MISCVTARALLVALYLGLRLSFGAILYGIYSLYPRTVVWFWQSSVPSKWFFVQDDEVGDKSLSSYGPSLPPDLSRKDAADSKTTSDSVRNISKKKSDRQRSSSCSTSSSSSSSSSTDADRRKGRSTKDSDKRRTSPNRKDDSRSGRDGTARRSSGVSSDRRRKSDLSSPPPVARSRRDSRQEGGKRMTDRRKSSPGRPSYNSDRARSRKSPTAGRQDERKTSSSCSKPAVDRQSSTASSKKTSLTDNGDVKKTEKSVENSDKIDGGKKKETLEDMEAFLKQLKDQAKMKSAQKWNFANILI